MDTISVDPIVAEEEFGDQICCDVGDDVCGDMFEFDFQFDLTDDVQWCCVCCRTLSCLVDKFAMIDRFQEILMNDCDGGACVDDCLGWFVINLYFDVDRALRR